MLPSDSVHRRPWPVRVTIGALRRLRWFPFTLLDMLLFAAVRVYELRAGHAVVRAGRASNRMTSLPLRAMLWLDRIASDLPSGSFDVCLRLPRDAADATLHDVFSVLLASPRLASIGLYWDDAALSDDHPLWQAGAGYDESSGANDIDAPSVERLDRFFRGEHEGLDLPVAARREAQTLLKRQAGAACAICLNLPAALSPLCEAIVTAAPDVRFFDLGAPGSKPLAAKVTLLADYGLTLHERLAFLQAADGYVGRFDELGSTAIMGGRPAVLVGGGDSASETSRVLGPASRTMWFPGSPGPEVAEEIAEFLKALRRIGVPYDFREAEEP
jgi:hypothetical protein